MTRTPLTDFGILGLAPVFIGEAFHPGTFWGIPMVDGALFATNTHTARVLVRYNPGGFWAKVAGASNPISPLRLLHVPYVDVGRITTGRAILNSQGLGSYDPSTLSALIGTMLLRGDPVANGLSSGVNWFPCLSGLVGIGWIAGYGEWWFRDDEIPPLVASGDRVFSGNYRQPRY